MKYRDENENYIKAECVKCGKVLDVNRSFCKTVTNGYDIDTPIKCTCGEESKYIRGKDADDTIRCPKCNSIQLTAGNKGFGLGKAALGGVLLGPVGLLGGLIGSKKVMITCLKCGHKWKAGK